MARESKAQTTVNVGIEVFWEALAMDMNAVLPRVVPNLVKDAQVLEGDGGLGTVFLFKFGPDVKTFAYQKEKIVELDESLHLIGIQVIEGVHLNLGFTSYTTFFQLTAITESETIVDIKVVYETDAEETQMPEKTTKSTLAFIKCLETDLLNNRA